MTPITLLQWNYAPMKMLLVAYVAPVLAPRLVRGPLIGGPYTAVRVPWDSTRNNLFPKKEKANIYTQWKPMENGLQLAI